MGNLSQFNVQYTLSIFSSELEIGSVFLMLPELFWTSMLYVFLVKDPLQICRRAPIKRSRRACVIGEEKCFAVSKLISSFSPVFSSPISRLVFLAIPMSESDMMCVLGE